MNSIYEGLKAIMDASLVPTPIELKAEARRQIEHYLMSHTDEIKVLWEVASSLPGGYFEAIYRPPGQAQGPSQADLGHAVSALRPLFGGDR